MPFTPSPVELSGPPSGGRWTSLRVAWSTDLDRLARSLDPVLAFLLPKPSPNMCNWPTKPI